MLDFDQQKSKYLWLIEKLRIYKFEKNIVGKIAEWDNRTGVVGFPYKYSLCIAYKNVPGSNMDLNLYLDQDGNWSKVEIVNIDIAENYQHQELGRELVKQAVNIAKAVGAKRIYGDALDKSNYSSVGFYKKCGFEICEDSMPRTFYMKIIENY